MVKTSAEKFSSNLKCTIASDQSNDSTANGFLNAGVHRSNAEDFINTQFPTISGESDVFRPKEIDKDDDTDGLTTTVDSIEEPPLKKSFTKEKLNALQERTVDGNLLLALISHHFATQSCACASPSVSKTVSSSSTVEECIEFCKDSNKSLSCIATQTPIKQRSIERQMSIFCTKQRQITEQSGMSNKERLLDKLEKCIRTSIDSGDNSDRKILDALSDALNVLADEDPHLDRKLIADNGPLLANAIIIPPSQVVDLLVEHDAEIFRNGFIVKRFGEECPKTSSADSNDRHSMESRYQAPSMTKLLKDIGQNLTQEFTYSDIVDTISSQRASTNIETYEQVSRQLASVLDGLKRKNEPYKLKRFFCQICSFYTDSRISLAAHLQTPHFNGRKYQCGLCNKLYTNENRISQHYLKRHGLVPGKENLPLRNPCPCCDEDFMYKIQREQHLKTCRRNFFLLERIMAPRLLHDQCAINEWIWSKPVLDSRTFPLQTEGSQVVQIMGKQKLPNDNPFAREEKFFIDHQQLSASMQEEISRKLHVQCERVRSNGKHKCSNDRSRCTVSEKSIEGSDLESFREEEEEDISKEQCKPAKRPRGSVNVLLWSHFAKLETDRIKCKICSEIIKTKESSTSPLHNHLRRKHCTTYAEYLQKKSCEEIVHVADDKKSDKESWKADEARCARTKTDNLTSIEAIRLQKDMAVVTFLATTNQPFSLVKEPGFIRFVQALDPNYDIRSRLTHIRKKWPILYEYVRAAVFQVLARELPACDSVAFTMSSWPTVSGNSHEYVTLYYINSQFMLQKFVTNCQSSNEQRSTSEIDNILSTVVQDVPGLEKECIVYIVSSETARNMQTTITTSSHIRGRAFKCFNTILYSATARAIMQTPFHETVKRCRDLAYFVGRSQLQRLIIKQACYEIEPRVGCRRIVQPVKTCCKSLYYCLDSILKLKQPMLHIKAQAKNGNLKNLADRIPNIAQFVIIEEIIEPLEEIKAACETFSDTEKPTIHLAMLHLATLGNIENKYRGGTENTKLFCEAFNNYLQFECPNGGKDIYEYCLANFLHPKYKGTLLKRNKDKETFNATLDRLIEEHPSWEAFQRIQKERKSTNQRELNAENYASAWEKELDMLTENDMVEQEIGILRKTKSDIEIEIHRYLHGTPPHDSATVDILEWWSKRQREFPLLSGIARRILCIPVCSASDIPFFATRNTLSPLHKTRLGPEYLEWRFFILQNYGKVSTTFGLKSNTHQEFQLFAKKETVQFQDDEIDEWN